MADIEDNFDSMLFLQTANVRNLVHCIAFEMHFFLIFNYKKLKINQLIALFLSALYDDFLGNSAFFACGDDKIDSCFTVAHLVGM